MSSIEEKRVYADKSGERSVYLATDLGVLGVSVSDDLIGSFGIEHRCHARDLAWVDGLAVATDEDVLFEGEPTDFGPAVAVGGAETPIAVGPEGRVARLEGEEWTDIGSLDDVRAANGDLLATGEGVYRVGDGLDHVGLEGVHDVSVPGVPLAATDAGIYRLGNGWMHEFEGEFDRVSGIGSPGELSLGATLAAGALSTYDGEWHERETPEPFVAVAVGEAVYGASSDGTLYVDAGDGWRSQALGVSGIRAMLVR
ncbi:HVO_0234 family beta-propeller protein [Halalkalicoccus subterraneus]|uniref:HVO_0234 family beta-propeller protein n=1 Tax=Halalkalicoccus subterraneus TaxID=2675002 RepID=UPI000EFA3771|nr:hypothetical protein [Halalkalicoccus subterraneus]